MTIPRPVSYKAEILRYLHDECHGELRDDTDGISRHIWNAKGQLVGEHFASVCSTLSLLEDEGCLITEFGQRTLDGHRCRVEVLLVEEPPQGSTVYHPQNKNDEPNEPDDPGRYPTPEEVAEALLKAALAAASVPVTDILAARHHAECLAEEVDSWRAEAEETHKRWASAENERAVAAAEVERLHTLNKTLVTSRECSLEESKRVQDKAYVLMQKYDELETKYREVCTLLAIKEEATSPYNIPLTDEQRLNLQTFLQPYTPRKKGGR